MKVARQNVAVVGVHHGGNSSQSRRDPSQGAGLGGVGVDNGGPFVPHEPIELEQRAQVVEGADGATEFGKHGEADAPGAREVEEVAFVFVSLSEHQPGLETVTLKAGTEMDHMQGGATDVEAGKDAQDPSHQRSRL